MISNQSVGILLSNLDLPAYRGPRRKIDFFNNIRKLSAPLIRCRNLRQISTNLTVDLSNFHFGELRFTIN